MGYLMFNTFINAILTQWPHTFGANLEKGVENVTGLKAIAGIETLDTNILGGIIISAIVTWIHNRFIVKITRDVRCIPRFNICCNNFILCYVANSCNYLCRLANNTKWY